MAKDSDPLAGAFETKESGGLLSGLLAEEDEFDRRVLWRLGSWGAAAVGAVIVAVMANQAQLGWRRDQLAAADMARQAERLQMLTKESQNETRRLASAIETLNTDRDRLYSRVTVLEQGLDSVTGAIAKQNAAQTAPPQQTASKPQSSNPEPPAAAAPPSPQAAVPGPVSGPVPSPAPSVAPVASTPSPATDKPRADAAKDQAGRPQQTAAAASLGPAATAPATQSALPTIPLVASKSIMAPPDPAASKLIQPEKPATEAASPPAEVAAAPPAKEPEAAAEQETPAITVQQTRFAIDLGGASSVGGLRALWRGLIKSNPELAALRPIIMIKESNTGLGMQLRLGAGPLVNAAAAAKICATLAESDHSCDTAVFDGQRLSMKGQEAAPQAETPPPSAAAKPDKQQHRRSNSKRSKHEEPAPQPAPAKPETTSTLSSFFSRR